MRNEGRRRRAAVITVASAAVLALVAAAWVAVGTAARGPYLEFAARTRRLEASIAARAMTEGFQVTIDQSSIIASYSLPEYFQGKRDELSIRQLLEVQRLKLAGVLVDAYLDPSGRPIFISRGEGGEAASEAVSRTAPAAWAWLSSRKGPYVDAQGGDGAFFVYYHPVLRNGTMVGMFASGVDLVPAIARYIAPLEDRRGRRAYLLGGDRRVLWSSSAAENGKTFDDAARRAEALTDQSFNLGGYAFHVVITDDDVALAAALLPAERMRDVIFVIGIAALAAIAAMIARLKYSESERREHLVAEKGLEAAVASREKELAESELRFETLFVRASDAIVIMSVSGEILRCNPRTASIFGYPEEKLIGKGPLDLSPPLQGGRPSAELLSELMLRGRDVFPEPIVFEWRFLRSDGSAFDSEMSISVIEAAGTRYVQGILRDVTERKLEVRLLQESLEEREILLRELHHRVKNNLQYVESLISLQRVSAPDEVDRALAKIQGRVASLAVAYLAAADRPETLLIETPAYLRAICDYERSAACAEGTRLEIALECEELPVGLDAAVSLGLILRELLENAAQHGYGRCEGRAEVSFAREGDAAVLSVRDRGAGPAEGWKPALGLSLVEALSAQLSGTISLSGAAPGFTAVLTFPLS